MWPADRSRNPPPRCVSDARKNFVMARLDRATPVHPRLRALNEYLLFQCGFDLLGYSAEFVRRFHFAGVQPEIGARAAWNNVEMHVKNRLACCRAVQLR